jgi:hypothetical protein
MSLYYLQWDQLDSLIDDAPAKAKVQTCKADNAVAPNDCESVHKMYKCVSKEHAEALRAAYDKHYNTNPTEFQQTLRALMGKGK